MSEIVSENIANANGGVAGIKEEAPLCACSPECDKRVRRSPQGGGWNKYGFGHNPATKGKTKGAGSSRSRDSFGTNMSEFNAQVFDKATYEMKMKIKDEKTFKFLMQVSKGDRDEVTVLYLDEEKLKPGFKYFNNCIEVLKLKINVELGAGHLAFTVK